MKRALIVLKKNVASAFPSDPLALSPTRFSRKSLFHRAPGWPFVRPSEEMISPLSLFSRRSSLSLMTKRRSAAAITLACSLAETWPRSQKLRLRSLSLSCFGITSHLISDVSSFQIIHAIYHVQNVTFCQGSVAQQCNVAFSCVSIRAPLAWRRPST